MEVNKLLGIIFILGACFVVFFNHGLTGAVVGILSWNYIDLIALAVLVAGILLFLYENKLERNIASEILKSGTVITDPKKIKKIAKEMGYKEGREVKEGYQIISHGHPLTVIPHHHISSGVYRNIMKALSSGESSFRKYSHA